MGSATHVALPAIQGDLHLNAIALAWVPTLYLLSCAVFLVPLGKIADIYGRKKIFTWGIWVFTLSSILSAAAPTAFLFLLSRAIQGVGNAMIFVAGLAMVTSVFPPNERGKAIGLNVASVYIGLSTGPVLGGILTHHFTWRSVFAATVPLGMVTIYLAMRKLKGEWAEARGESIDVVGSILYGLAIVLLMYGLSDLMSKWGILFVCSGLFLLGTFVWWEGRVPFPIFNLELFASNRVFALSSVAALIHYSATFAISFMLSLYLQYVKGMSPHASGLVLMAQPLMMAFLSPAAGKISDRIEPRIIASMGMTITAIGLLAMSLLTAHTSVALITGVLLLLGLGYALFSSPNMNAIMGSVEKKHYGLASGTVSTMRLLGNMLSMGIATLTFSLFIGPVQIGPEHYEGLLRSLKITFVAFALLCMGGIGASLARGRMRPERERG